MVGHVGGIADRGPSRKLKGTNHLTDPTPKTIAVPKEPMSRRRTIFIVDDEELLRGVTLELLGYLGYEAAVASTGEEAVERIRDGFRPDIVLLDVVMPGIGGVEAFRRIRQLAPEIPILLTSGFTDPDAASSLLEEGLNGIIPKPYRMEILGARIREILA